MNTTVDLPVRALGATGVEENLQLAADPIPEAFWAPVIS
jgi:hypothetical protein